MVLSGRSIAGNFVKKCWKKFSVLKRMILFTEQVSEPNLKLLLFRILGFANIYLCWKLMNFLRN